ncbi:MAG TPA: ribonuclease HI [Solirubrobacteraceae bacterium]
MGDAKTIPVVECWTDGACSGNPGPGGWAALLRIGEREREVSGGERLTTNNRMEMLAVLEGLRALRRPCRVLLHTDSRYVMDAFTKGWLVKWQRNGWRRADKQPVKNRELWEELVVECGRHEVEWTWVRGHAGTLDNERVDGLAVVERDRFASGG